MTSLSRRSFLTALPAGVGLWALGRPLMAQAPVQIDLRAAETSAQILDRKTTGLFSYAAGGPAPVLRLKQGVPAKIAFQNDLDEPTTVHWHGLRVPNAMDGVAWVTQIPLGKGERFDYTFTPQDAGTYWYHPHCNTFDQLQRGLNGIVIVEEADPPAFDADVPLVLRDFRLRDDGQFSALSIPRNAARGGTLGKVMTVNWAVAPDVAVPAGGVTRVRLANTDVTRLHKLFIPGSRGKIVALDGHPVEADHPWPDRAEEGLWLAPGQRADLALIGPDLGQALDLMTDTEGGTVALARFVGQGAALTRGVADIPVLPANPLPRPNLDRARVIDFVFGWSPQGKAKGASALCGDTGQRFWSINRIAAAGDGPEPGAPLAVLRRGETVILRLRNETQNHHPIHLHGMAFKLLTSDRRKILPQWTDTALLLEGETMEVALVADNPGDWVFHCHVIEHQKTGLSGFLRVE